MVICGNGQPWEADERTSTNNLDASLLRWTLSTWAHRDTTWTTVDISTAFLTVKMPAEQLDIELVLLKPQAVLVKLGLLKEDDIWIATRAVYGLRSAPRSWEQSPDDVLKTCDFTVDGAVKALPGAPESKARRCYSLCKSSLSPSIWYIVPCSLRDQKTTGRSRMIREVMDRQEVSDALMKWIQSKWSTGQLEQASAAKLGSGNCQL
eukprot:4927274-Amphidinium_carterae.2